MWHDRAVTTQSVAVDPVGGDDDAPIGGIGESRWPPALALVVFMALNIAIRVWLPNEGAIRVAWLLPAIEGVLLAVLVVGPATAGRHRGWLRGVSVSLVGVLVLAALWATGLLVYDLIKGIGVTNSPTELLATGGVVWLGNNLAFGLLFWLMDAGGPIARWHNPGVTVDFEFTQQLSPDVCPDGWRPVFLDYLHLGFTNSTAFSPTDVMPLSLRAKYAMLVQSTVSLALFGLIVARAVNAFT